MRRPSQPPGPAIRAAGAAVALACLVPALGGPSALGAQELRYTRPIDVAEPGWVRVPLDPEILRRAAPAGGHLRLFGPDGEEMPFLRVPSEDGAGPDRPLGVTVSEPECRVEEGSTVGPGTVCSLPLGFAGRLLRRLQLTVAATEPVGFRLLVPEDGRWEPAAEGIWSAPLPETPHEVELDLSLPDPAEPLRLELYGGARPELVRVSAEMGLEDLLFEARRDGRHTLAYGPVVFRSSRSDALRPPPGAEPVRVPPGPEEAGEVAGRGTALPETAGPAPSVRFERRWRVTTDAPDPGSLQRLTLEPAVYAAARVDLADLRLLTGDLQVPFVRWRPEAPVVAATLRGVRPPVEPGDSGDAARDRVEIDPGAPELPFSALVVHSGAERIRTRVRVLGIGAPAPGEEPRVVPLGPWREWTCDRRAPLSCRLVVGLNGDPTGPRLAEALGGPGGRLLLEVRGAGSETGPAPFDVDLLRRRDLLLFPWPSGGEPVRLVAGAEDLGPADYDLRDRSDEILARPWLRAGLVSGEEPAGDGGVGRWTVAVTLAVAFGALLILLHGLLAEREPSQPGEGR
jgi:hypothetical protein